MTAPISLIMTVYNREHYLEAAIQSVLAQTQPNFELLIWDDGSTDGSLAIAQRIAQQDPRVKLIEAKHQGRVLSLKDAHAEVKGDYLGWVDSDDILAPAALAETAAILDSHPHVGVVYTDYLEIDENGKVKGPSPKRCRIPYSKERLLIDFMTFHFRLFRRTVFEQSGGIDLYFEVAVDYDLCLRLSEVAVFRHLERPLYYYRRHRESISETLRLRQIYYSREAIARALKRRGLAEKYQIEVKFLVQTRGRLFLTRKPNPQLNQMTEDPEQQRSPSACAEVPPSLQFGKDFIRQFFRENLMRESIVYQEIIQEGVEQGLYQGKREEALGYTTRLLTRRIGSITPELHAQIQELPLAQLEDLGEALLDFANATDLTTWLQTYCAGPSMEMSASNEQGFVMSSSSS